MPKQTNDTENQISNAASIAKEDFSNAIDGVLSGDLTSILPLVKDYVLPVVSTLAILILGFYVSRFISRILSLPITKRIDETLGKFVAKLVFYSLFLFVILGILGKFGISVASFAAVIAAAGFAIGLAFQNTLSNFAAGVLLLVFRPFKVGDYIKAAGTEGLVSEIDLFTTTLDTIENERVIVPNSEISASKITNSTFHQTRRVHVNVGTDYKANIDQTRESLNSAVNSLGQVVSKHQVYLLELADSSVNWQVRAWCSTVDYWDVREKLTQAIKESLDSDNISIPYPTLELNIEPNSLLEGNNS